MPTAIIIILILMHLVVLAEVDALWTWIITSAVIAIGFINHNVFIVVVRVEGLIVRIEWVIREWTGDVTVRVI